MFNRIRTILNTILVISCHLWLCLLPALGYKKMIVIENYHLAFSILALYIILYEKLKMKPY